jgi:CheY-like chemotaxis protein
MVRSHSTDGKLVVEIADTGIGIAPEALTKIFQPFGQADEVQKDRRFGGLGLGLSISKAILDQHGAKIEVESEGIGRGATFRVALTLTDASLPRPAIRGSDLRSGAMASNGAKRASLRVLLVEDHQATVDVLRRLLTRAGHQVTAATTVASAWQAAAKAKFDFVISDLGLPDGTGFQLMEDLRNAYSLRGIALSGYGMDEDRRRARAAGFAAHLTKPVDFQRLQQAVSEMVGA